MAEKVKQDEGIENGFVFQGDQYEGGVCNGLEYIWTHGGDVLDPNDPNKIVIDSPEAAEGLANRATAWWRRVSLRNPCLLTGTRPTRPLNGEAVFAWNWPYMYALAGTEDYPDVDTGTVRRRAVAGGGGEPAFPARSAGGTAHQRCVGHAGRGLGSSSSSLTSEESQKIGTLDGSSCRP
jgi:multiple sugar transport system substrate-binding protein